MSGAPNVGLKVCMGHPPKMGTQLGEGGQMWATQSYLLRFKSTQLSLMLTASHPSSPNPLSPFTSKVPAAFG